MSGFQLVKAGGEALVCLRDRGIRFLFVAGPVFAVTSATQHFPCPNLGVPPFPFRRFPLDIGERSRQGEMALGDGAVRVSGLNHSTPWASGSSAASFAHLSATSLPSIPWWLGYHRISILTLGSVSASRDRGGQRLHQRICSMEEK